MKGLRDVLSELVERRLWPVALLLVVALVAVPLVLAKQPPAGTGAGAPPAPPADAATADLTSAGEPVVSIAPTAGAQAPLRGRVKNPFEQQHVPAREAEDGGGTPPPGSGSGDAPNGGGGSNGGAGEQPQTYRYASIDVRFGKAGMSLRTFHDVPRLTPLPNASRPIVIFMGMRADGQTAVFMVSTDVHAQGEGRCVPSKKLCEAIELKRGDIALLDWAEPDGSVTQYELDLDDVALHETTSKAQADASIAATRDRWLGEISRHARSADLTVLAVTGTAGSAPSLSDERP